MISLRNISAYFLIFFLFIISPVKNVLAEDEPVWYEKDVNNQPVINLYFFWSEKCPHCQHALPDIIEIDKEYPWLTLHSL